MVIFFCFFNEASPLVLYPAVIACLITVDPNPIGTKTGGDEVLEAVVMTLIGVDILIFMY